MTDNYPPGFEDTTPDDWDTQYQAWLMDNCRELICNGDDLIRLFESGHGFSEFLWDMHEQRCREGHYENLNGGESDER